MVPCRVKRSRRCLTPPVSDQDTERGELLGHVVGGVELRLRGSAVVGPGQQRQQRVAEGALAGLRCVSREGGVERLRRQTRPAKWGVYFVIALFTGMVMIADSLLKENGSPSETEIRQYLEGNICRCTGYHNIVKSIQAAASEMSASRVAAE